MHNFHSKIAIWLIFSFCLYPFSQSFASGGDDVDCTADDGSCGINPLAHVFPMAMPDADQHRGRGLVRIAPQMLPLSLVAAAPTPIVTKSLALPKQDLPKALMVNKGSNKIIPPLKQPQAVLAPYGMPENRPEKIAEPNMKRAFPHRLKTPRPDPKYGRKVLTLPSASPDDPYVVLEKGLFYGGMLLSMTFIEPHTLIQFNGMTKFKITSGNSSHRRADNYDDAIRKSWAKYPKKVKDFEKWKNGDWVRRHTSFSMAFYAGAAYFLPDARSGIVTETVRSIHYQKLDADHIRISITKEFGAGAVARISAAPFNKAEAKKLHNRERTYVYLFDLTKENEFKALEDVVERSIIFAGDEAYHAAKHDEAVMLTSRLIKRNKSNKTPLQLGIPLLCRARTTWQTDKYRTAITTRRAGTEYFYIAKAYNKQSLYRHKNFKKYQGSHKGKAWKNFTDKHYHYNRSYTGGVVKPPKIGGIDRPLEIVSQQNNNIELLQVRKRKATGNEKKVRYRYINIQRSFSNDRVTADDVNTFLKKFSRKAGVNDYKIDVGYKSSALIGYAEVRWDFRVGPNAIDIIVKKAVADKDLFKQHADDVMDEYFAEKDGVKNDPHKFCRSKIIPRDFCIERLRKNTHDSLKEIAKTLRKLNEESIAKSSSKSASKLSKIAKILATHQFILQAFILAMPPNHDGYGRLQVFGERFAGKEFNTDPHRNMKELNSFSSPWTDVQPDGSEEADVGALHDYYNVDDEDLVEDDANDFDWDRIANNRAAINEF